MLVDLLLIALLVNAGGVLLGLAAAVAFFRISARAAGGNLIRRSVRITLRTLGAVFFFIACVSLGGKVFDAQDTTLSQGLKEANAEVGLLGVIRTVADDLGLGFGWTGLYFTAFLALWRGQTPGKRLVGIRVMRLNGGQITWGVAFERFGGYAAGLFTGLLGFLQVIWDHNRQAIHDKICETVVVKVRSGS